MARILLIDDDIEFLTYVKEIVQSSGHLVDTATGSKEALELVKDVDYSLVFLDLKMPEYSGHDFLTIYNSMYLDRNTPIIILSADNSENAYQKSIKEGARDFLSKPIKNKVSFLKLIDQYVGS